MCLVKPKKQKKYPDKITVTCGNCQSVFTYERISRSALTYNLASDEVRCNCFQPIIEPSTFAGDIQHADFYPRTLCLYKKKPKQPRF